MTYEVTATRQGAPYATVTVDQPDALNAIGRAEQMLKAKPMELTIGEKGEAKKVMWTGLDFTARKVKLT
jgi:hypothetical protein